MRAVPFDPAALPPALANRVLEREEWARTCLAAHAGTHVSMTVGPVAATMRVDAAGRLEAATATGESARPHADAVTADGAVVSRRPARWDEFVTAGGDPCARGHAEGAWPKRCPGSSSGRSPEPSARSSASASPMPDGACSPFPVRGARVGAERRELRRATKAPRRAGRGGAPFGDEVLAPATRVDALAARLDALAGAPRRRRASRRRRTRGPLARRRGGVAQHGEEVADGSGEHEQCQMKCPYRSRESAAKNATPAMYASPPAPSSSKPGSGTRSARLDRDHAQPAHDQIEGERRHGVLDPVEGLQRHADGGETPDERRTASSPTGPLKRAEREGRVGAGNQQEDRAVIELAEQRLGRAGAAPRGRASMRSRAAPSSPRTRLAPTTFTGLPLRAVVEMRTGADATAATSPSPWLTLLAISSPSVCGVPSSPSSSCVSTRGAEPGRTVRSPANPVPGADSIKATFVPDPGRRTEGAGRRGFTLQSAGCVRRALRNRLVALKYGLDEFLTGHERFRAVRPAGARAHLLARHLGTARGSGCASRCRTWAPSSSSSASCCPRGATSCRPTSPTSSRSCRTACRPFRRSRCWRRSGGLRQAGRRGLQDVRPDAHRERLGGAGALRHAARRPPVAVKVLRPGIARRSTRTCRCFTRGGPHRALGPTAIGFARATWSRNSRRRFRRARPVREAANCARCAATSSIAPPLVPEVHWDYCTPRRW